MSAKRNQKQLARLKKKQHIKKKVTGTPQRPRLVVYKSLKHIYTQLVDDTSQKTITGLSSLSNDLKDDVSKAKSKIEVAGIVGERIAKKALDLKFDSVIFDRNGYIYHGRVKAVAEAARKGGLKF